MGYRIHSNTPENLRVAYVNDPAVYFSDEEMAVGPSLVLDDHGNMEAFTIVGSPTEIAELARRILDILPVALTDAEQSYLTYICEDHGYDVDAGSIGRADSGWAYFLSDEDATGFDLTNEQEREVTYDD